MRWLHGITDSMDMNLANSGEGQGSLACDSAWGHKELNMTQQPNNNNVAAFYHFYSKCIYNLISKS